MRTGAQGDEINQKPFKKHTKHARELGTTTQKDAPLTYEHDASVRSLTAQTFEHDPPPGRDDDDDDDDGPHKFVRPTLATKGSCLALTQLRIARNETKRFPGSGDG